MSRQKKGLKKHAFICVLLALVNSILLGYGSVSHQNMRGGFSGRSSCPDGHYSHCNRQSWLTSPNVISNSLKVEGSNVKQPKYFEAPYSFYRDYDLHSSSTQSDCKNIHSDVSRI
ncbi:hypothetical protein CUMW_119600 [Citrus unshiu]|nr:hypothetical protein CUMW_119600 [Citrus unshiu]